MVGCIWGGGGGDLNAIRKFRGGSGDQVHLSICNLDKTAKFIQPQLKYVSAGVLMGSSKGDCDGFLYGTIGVYPMPLHKACAVTQLRGTLTCKVFTLGPLRVFKRL